MRSSHCPSAPCAEYRPRECPGYPRSPPRKPAGGFRRAADLPAGQCGCSRAGSHRAQTPRPQHPVHAPPARRRIRKRRRRRRRSARRRRNVHALAGRTVIAHHPGAAPNVDRSARVGNTVDQIGSIVAHQHGPIGQNHGRDRASPRIAVIDNETGEEVVVFAGRHAVVHAHAHKLVASAETPVPRPMKRGDPVADIFLGERRFARCRGIERKGKSGGMGLDRARPARSLYRAGPDARLQGAGPHGFPCNTRANRNSRPPSRASNSREPDRRQAGRAHFVVHQRSLVTG